MPARNWGTPPRVQFVLRVVVCSKTWRDWFIKLSEQIASVFDRLTGRSATAAERLHVRSALNPMLWLCAIVSPVSFGIAWLTVGYPTLSLFFCAVGFLPIAFTCLGFAYFVIFDPKKLQSEDYQIRHEALELIKEKGSALEISPLSIEAIANPRNDGATG